MRALWVSHVFLLLAWAAMPVLGYDANGTEDRCVELGAGCLCAEPLTDDFDLPNYTGGQHWDPDSSVDSIECNGEQQNGRAVTLTPGYASGPAGTSSMIRAADEVPFPSGANPFVYKSTATGISHIRNVEPVTLNGDTLCIRVYRRWNSGFVMTSSAHRVKNIELARINSGSNLSHINYEHNWNGSTFFHTVVDNVHNLDGNAPAEGGWQTRCNQNWCRLEICADQSGSRIAYRFSMTDLGDGHQSNVSFPSDASSASPTFWWQVAQLFVQGRPSTYEAQYVSHLLVAKVPHDPSWWIGEAYELEGGEAGPPIDPPVDPPVDPPPGEVMAVLSELREPDRDVQGQVLRTLQKCEIERILGGEDIGELAIPATSVSGGGVHEDIDLLPDYPDACGVKLEIQTDCLNDPGRGTKAAMMEFMLGPCDEAVPKAPIQVR